MTDTFFLSRFLKWTVNINKSSIKHYFSFFWVMTEKEIKARYKKTILGFLWVLLNPLLQMAIIGFVFSFFMKIQNYYLFLFAGLLPWSFFSQSISKATPSIVSERRLLQKAKFATEIIPLSVVLSNFLHLIVSIALLLIFLIITQFSQVALLNFLIIIPALVWLFILTAGISLLAASLQVRYRDINYIVKTLLTLGFYATPVIYTLSLVPEKLRILFALNPLVSIIELFHKAVLSQGLIDLKILSANLFITVAIVFSGILAYKAYSKDFVDWL